VPVIRNGQEEQAAGPENTVDLGNGPSVVRDVLERLGTDDRVKRRVRKRQRRRVALDAAGLASFVAAFPTLRYEVRPPTLDDLFLALAREGQS